MGIKLKAFAAALFLLALGANAPSTQVRLSQNSEHLSAVRLDEADADDRTVTLSIKQKWAKIRFGVAYTFGAATSVVLTPSCSSDKGVTYKSLITRSCTAGSCESNVMTDVESSGASFAYWWEYDVRGCTHWKIVLSAGGSPTSADIVTTQAIAVVGD